MQIGCCWFDNTRRLLVDQTAATQWHLNDHEYWVLSQLVQHRGQVVPLSMLETVAISGECPHQLSHAELLDIIGKIINYMCQRHTNLIEYVPEQGVILYTTAATKRTKILELPERLLSLGQYLFIIVILLCVLLFVYSKLNPPEFAQADVLRQVLTPDGRIVELFVFGNNNQQDAILHADCLSSQLRLCHNIRWNSIQVALSVNQDYMSFTLTDSSEAPPLVNSIKVSIDNMNTPFITQQWLQKVHICG
ncbi:hypothetical protein [Shewanella sp. SG41-4]|uniref:hypothetical protein n=1 Tax=Shewanella sp. SG41-4 TaxID=2760976 RepID=UPI00160009FE|nr:hypothetical protein [Shewanella sp. SG41-4]